MVKAVLFDLGDTLIDFAPMDTRRAFAEGTDAVHRLLAERGFDPPAPDRFFRRLFRSIRWAYLWAKFRRREFNFVDLVQRELRRHGIHLDDALRLEVGWRLYEPVARHGVVADDVVSTLNHLRNAGLRLGLVSNTFVPGPVMDRQLAAAGLLPLLPVRIYSADVGLRKPDPRIFRLALDRLGVAGAEAVFVGDLVKADILGARKAGMVSVLRQPFHVGRGHRLAGHVIRRIGELPAIVLPRDDARAEASRELAALRV